jgi:hypothetical protein
MSQTFSGHVASLFVAWQTCCKNGNKEWEERHHDTLYAFVRKFMPSGAGIDTGTGFDFEKSKPDRLVFTTAFHHMDEDGYYDGWTYHDVIVKPSLAFGLDITITGKNRNDIKEYLHETYFHALTQPYCAGEIPHLNA